MSPERYGQIAGGSSREWLSDEDSASEQSMEEQPESADDVKRRRRQETQRRKLQALKDRERDLTAALLEVEEQRARMDGKSGGISKKGVKFKARQRKR